MDDELVVADVSDEIEEECDLPIPAFASGKGMVNSSFYGGRNDGDIITSHSYSEADCRPAA